MRRNGWLSVLLCGAVLVTAGVILVNQYIRSGLAAERGQWPVAGASPDNSRSQPAEHLINSSNAVTLAPKWVFTTGGSVSATPVVADGAVYFPDWAGNLYAVDQNTGKQIWSAKISSYVGDSGALSRVSPVAYNDELIFGDNQQHTVLHGGAHLIAVNRSTGALLWKTQIESHRAAIITGSAVISSGVVYQAVSSLEEGLGDDSGYPCCTFRGSVVAVDADTGKILWQTYDMPDNKGATNEYSGGAIWQPPVIDSERNLLYIGTGNNYTVPASVLACETSHPNATNCQSPDDHFDAALALDLQTGAIRWSRQLQGYDVWTVGCNTPTKPGVTCEMPKGPDNDLGGSGGNLLSNLIGFGQKSGLYWALHPDTGAILWHARPGPGGSRGGIMWGTATDGQRIYVAIGNSNHQKYTLVSGQTITWGSWSALDASTGEILWQTPDPVAGTLDTGAVSVANGVVYAGSLEGHMYAMDAATGKILWSYASGGSVNDGPAIVDGIVYWGSGYPHGGTNNNKVYAFEVTQ